MLTPLDFWHLVEHVIPLYVIVILAYVLTRLNVIAPEHGLGIGRWVSVIGVPAYVFYILAFNDPYQTNLRLVAADVLSKGLALFFACLWWKFSKSGSIDGVIGFFMLATLPNTVLIGDSLLQPLYGKEVHTEVVTIIFMQTLLWYNACICLYEARSVLLEEKQLQGELPPPPPPPPLSGMEVHSRDVDHILHVHESGFVAITVATALDHRNSTSNESAIELQDRSSNVSAVGARREDVIDERKESFGTDSDSRQESSIRLHLAGDTGRFRLVSGFSGAQQATLERTISAPPRFSISRSRSRSLSSQRTPDRKFGDVDFAAGNFSGPLVILKDNKTLVARVSASSPDAAAVLAMIANDVAEQESQKNSRMNKSFDRDENPMNQIISERSENQKKLGAELSSEPESCHSGDRNRRSSGIARWGILGLNMLNRMKKVPMTYASIAGFVYSLLAKKYNFEMPYPARTSVELISQGALGMAIFLMGMSWARSGRLISCGWKGLVYGVVVRFLMGPFLLIVSAKAVLMKGQPFRFAVLQAVIPQGVISFVLAKEYGVDIPLFNTAVVFQLVIFVPIALCYYSVLDKV